MSRCPGQGRGAQRGPSDGRERGRGGGHTLDPLHEGGRGGAGERGGGGGVREERWWRWVGGVREEWRVG